MAVSVYNREDNFCRLWDSLRSGGSLEMSIYEQLRPLVVQYEQRSLAEASGVHLARLNRWINGKGLLTVAEVEKLAAAIKMQITITEKRIKKNIGKKQNYY